MASTGGEASWRGVPDSDEVLYRRAQSGASDAAAPADAAPIGRAPVLVYEDDSLDMRVGDRASKRRRIISGVNKEVGFSPAFCFRYCRGLVVVVRSTMASAISAHASFCSVPRLLLAAFRRIGH